MSWDIILFNSSEKINSPENVNENLLIETNFDNLLANYFVNKNVNENHIEINGKNFSIEYFKDDELTSNKLLTLFGENGIYEIINFALKNNFQIFDTGLGEMIDLQNPKNNGYENFQKYLTQILTEKK